MDDKLMNELLNQASQLAQKKCFLLIGGVVFVIVALIALLFELRKGKLLKKYHLIASRKNILGADAAMQMLKSLGFDNIKVRFKSSKESDKYDSKAKTVYLSEKVHNGASLASLYTAARQVNNVLLHANNPKLSRMLDMYYKIAFINWFVFCVAVMPNVIVGVTSIAIAWVLFAVILVCGIAAASIMTMKTVAEIKSSKNCVKLLMNEQFIYDDETEIVKRIIHEEKISDVIEMIFGIIINLIYPICVYVFLMVIL